MRVLVLGGTRFLGRALVDSLLEQGHEPTLFNRGLTGAELFPEVEKLLGDRTSDLSALAGHEWDAVIDVACYHPPVAERSVEALQGRVGRYTFISTVSVYADQDTRPVESAAVLELAPGDEEDDRPETYGARKAACERIVEEAFGDRALVVRPGLIVGPHDPTGRFTYWPHRVARGGEVLAPGAPGDPVQFVDVRDLADWVVGATERGLAGTFNATGKTMAFAALLDACTEATASSARFTWVPSDELLAADVEEWMGVPLWIASPGWSAANRVVVDRAVAAGLTFRPLAETILGALHEADLVDGVGLTPERERELLRR
jgi:2'-hydroxyisoflavone reductase